MNDRYKTNIISESKRQYSCGIFDMNKPKTKAYYALTSIILLHVQDFSSGYFSCAAQVAYDWGGGPLGYAEFPPLLMLDDAVLAK